MKRIVREKLNKLTAADKEVLASRRLLVEYRQKKKISQRRLAQLLNVNSRTVQRWEEEGFSNPHLLKIILRGLSQYIQEIEYEKSRKARKDGSI